MSLAPSVQILVWQDIFAVVDNGRARPEEYDALRLLATAQAKRFPAGIGCLAIIPRDAVPPSDASREALNNALFMVDRALRCVCWLVEGPGFQGAMVRAVLTGLRFVKARSYATHVSTNLDDALSWMLTKLPGPEGARDMADLDEARVEILRQRREPTGGWR